MRLIFYLIYAAVNSNHNLVDRWRGMECVPHTATRIHILIHIAYQIRRTKNERELKKQKIEIASHILPVYMIFHIPAITIFAARILAPKREKHNISNELRSI